MQGPNFDNAQAGLESPGFGSFQITYDATIAIRALYVIAAGDVCFTGADGVDSTWTVPDNFIIPVAMTKVKTAGTTVPAASLRGIK